MTRSEMISAIQTLQQEVWGLKEQVARLVAKAPEPRLQGRPVRGAELGKL